MGLFKLLVRFLKRMSKILVTGGLGYIGSHVVVELQSNGFDVLIIDDLSNSSEQTLDEISKITSIKPSFFKIDLKNKLLVKEFFKNQSQIDGVIHFAASKSVGVSLIDPIQYYENNIISLINLLLEIEKLESPKLIFSSSCAIYGQVENLPITENSPSKNIRSPYANTKKISEEIIMDLSKSNNSFNSIVLRYFNAIGSHKSVKIGENSVNKPQNLVPLITRTAIGVYDELTIYGNDYSTPDGTPIRDYIHVVDLARAHVKAINHLIEQKNTKNFDVFNLGTGKGTSVLEIIKLFEKISGLKLNYTFSSRRPGDVESAYADSTKANKILGWVPEFSLLDGLLSAWEWEQNIHR